VKERVARREAKQRHTTGEEEEKGRVLGL